MEANPTEDIFYIGLFCAFIPFSSFLLQPPKEGCFSLPPAFGSRLCGYIFAWYLADRVQGYPSAPLHQLFPTDT